MFCQSLKLLPQHKSRPTGCNHDAASQQELAGGKRGLGALRFVRTRAYPGPSGLYIHKGAYTPPATAAMPRNPKVDQHGIMPLSAPPRFQVAPTTTLRASSAYRSSLTSHKAQHLAGPATDWPRSGQLAVGSSLGWGMSVNTPAEERALGMPNSTEPTRSIETQRMGPNRARWEFNFRTERPDWTTRLSCIAAFVKLPFYQSAWLCTLARSPLSLRLLFLQISRKPSLPCFAPRAVQLIGAQVRCKRGIV